MHGGEDFSATGCNEKVTAGGAAVVVVAPVECDEPPLHDARSSIARTTQARRHVTGPILPWRLRSIVRSPVATIARIRIRLAELDDVDVVLALLSEAAAWTASIGFPNWPARFSRDLVMRGVAGHTLHVAEADGSIIATMTLQWSDAMFWGERPDDAGYVHRLVVRRDRAGAGLGATLIDWAAQQVRASDRARLRLDVSADNLPLCSYYESLGFEHRGDAQGEFAQPDGGVRHWKARLYERECNEEKRR